jgi:glycerophosphoryl diester phosphodiesterase
LARDGFWPVGEIMGFAKHALLRDEFRVVAYRGGAKERPENTLAAFEHAASLARSIVIELDVRRTRDGILVAIHDDDVSRTTEGSGRVSNLDYGALQRLDAGYRFERGGQFPYRGRGINIPTVNEVLVRFPEQLLVLDVHGEQPSVALDLARLVERRSAEKRVVIASEHGSVIRQVKRAHPDWLLAGSAGQLRARVLLERIRLDALAPRTGGILMIPEVHGSLRVLTPRFVARAHARGERVWLWVVEQIAELERLRALGVDGVFTPNPAAFLAALG